MDYSRIDAMIGVRLRATGHSPNEVERAIEANGPAMRRGNMTEQEYSAKYRNRDWRKYAAETTERYVFGARGAVQYSKALDYRPHYMRLEGRDLNEEQRAEREQARLEKKESRGR
jgi:trehalose-6-phosphatase